jgi:CHAT domain-containing protein/Tfp pilus assembly protein PilF
VIDIATQNLRRTPRARPQRPALTTLVTQAVLATLFVLTAQTPAPAQQSESASTPASVSAPAPASPAFVAELLKAPDAAAREALLDAHRDAITDALRVAIREAGDRLRGEGKLADSLRACELERVVAVRLHDGRGIVSADQGSAQAYSLLGDYDRALAALRDAQQVAADLHDDKLQRRTLGNLAIVYRLRGNLDQALALQRQLLHSFEAEHSTADITRTLNNIAIIQEQRGEYRDALAAAQRGLSLEPPGTVVYAHSLHALANIYLAQGELDLAFESYRQALAQRDLAGPSKLPTLEMLGEVERMRHHFDEAADYLTQARTLAEAYNQQPQVAFTLRIEALVRADRGDKVGAVPLLERSLAIGRTVKDPDIISYTLTNLARLRRELGDGAAALTLAREAIALGDSQPPRGLAQAYREAGRACMALGRLADDGQRALISPCERDEARRALESSIEITEDMRDQVSGGGLEREQFFELRLEPYQAMMALLLDEGANEEALRYAERTRARVLLDEMQRGHVDLAHSLTPDERDQERAIERKLRTAKAADRAEARTALAAWRAHLFAVHPELRLTRGAATIPSLADLREIVRDRETVVLAYASVEDHTWLFAITMPDPRDLNDLNDPNGTPVLAVHRLSIDNDALATRVHALREALAQRSLDFATQAQAMYTLLMRPAAAALRGKSRVIIVPDGVCWDVPFQALQPARGQYLIDRAIVEYAPSLTFLFATHRQTTGAPRGDLLAIGAAPLPESARQVRAVAALYNPRATETLIGAAATEARVKADAARYRIVHLASHGVLDDRDPMYSAVLLHQDDGGDDGRLEARELMDLHLDADLVILSACETARGRIGAGEGLLGLSWALLIAGSRDVVVSQWKVDAASTSDLMIAFHRALVRNRKRNRSATPDVGAALQAATRQVRGDPRYRHPFYWAAFRTVGRSH